MSTDARAHSSIRSVSTERRDFARPVPTRAECCSGWRWPRTLLHDPSILLLDEPFTGLDRTGASALAAALATAKEGGRIILVITHDFEPIAGLTDHIVVLRRGVVAHEDQREDAIGSPELNGFSRQELTSLYHRHSE